VRRAIAQIRNKVALESIERETHPMFYNEELAREGAPRVATGCKGMQTSGFGQSPPSPASAERC
jgi:hypothetical protein